MFEAMADLMFENQRDWEFVDNPQSFFDEYALELGLDLNQFAADRVDPEIDERIQRDINSANSLGLSATPTFYLNGRELDLAEALNDFHEIIEDELDDFDDPFLIDRSTGGIIVSGHEVVRRSTAVGSEERLLSDSHLADMRVCLGRIHAGFAKHYGKSKDDELFAMEIEFKITSTGKLVIKQARPWVYNTVQDRSGT